MSRYRAPLPPIRSSADTSGRQGSDLSPGVVDAVSALK
nr:hypothetical protein [Kibdelosporangium sp. MJ126-NF4]